MNRCVFMMTVRETFLAWWPHSARSRFDRFPYQLFVRFRIRFPYRSDRSWSLPEFNFRKFLFFCCRRQNQTGKFPGNWKGDQSMKFKTCIQRTCSKSKKRLLNLLHTTKAFILLPDLLNENIFKYFIGNGIELRVIQFRLYTSCIIIIIIIIVLAVLLTVWIKCRLQFSHKFTYRVQTRCLCTICLFCSRHKKNRRQTFPQNEIKNNYVDPTKLKSNRISNI